jgi:hypothetical protein
MLRNVLAATLNLLFFRIGPEDFPFDVNFSRVLVPLAVLANYAVFVLVLPPGLSAAMALSMVAGVAFATRLLLRARRMDNRFLQTWHALLATGSVLTLALVPPFAQIAPEFAKLAQDPQLLQGTPQVNFPAGPAFLMNVFNIWNFAVSAHIYRHAAGVNIWIGALLALLVALSTLMFVMFFGSLAGILLGTTSTSS